MTDLQMLESQLKQARLLLDRRQMAMRLANNRDFKKLILDEFCVQEAARYAQASADPALSAEARADSLALAQASGHLKRWLSVTIQMASTVERDIPDLEQAIEQARLDEAGIDFAGNSDDDEDEVID